MESNFIKGIEEYRVLLTSRYLGRANSGATSVFGKDVGQCGECTLWSGGALCFPSEGWLTAYGWIGHLSRCLV